MSNCRAHLVVFFPSFRNHYSSLPEAQCLENCYFIHSVCFLVVSDRRVNLVPVTSSCLKVEVWTAFFTFFFFLSLAIYSTICIGKNSMYTDEVYRVGGKRPRFWSSVLGITDYIPLPTHLISLNVVIYPAQSVIVRIAI